MRLCSHGAGPLAGFVLADKAMFFKMLPQRIFAGIAQFPVLAIPLGSPRSELMNRQAASPRPGQLRQRAGSGTSAGLAQTNILASMLFAGLSGSAVADTSAIGSILIPAMEKEGYSKQFAAAVTAASSVIGPIIPPSIIMIIYAYVMKVSVAALFLAGVIPGIMVGAGLMLVTAYIGKRRNYPKAPRRASGGEIWAAFKKAFLPLLTPVIILGGIISGVVTPTESAGAAVFYALFLSLFITRAVKFEDLPAILYRTGLVSSTILLIIGSATIFGWVARCGATTDFGKSGSRSRKTPTLLLLLVNVFLLITGMFLDVVPAIMILVRPRPGAGAVWRRFRCTSPHHVHQRDRRPRDAADGLVLFVASGLARRARSHV